MINGYRNNSKPLWKIVQDITIIQNIKNEITCVRNEIDRNITQTKDIANELNETSTNM